MVSYHAEKIRRGKHMKTVFAVTGRVQWQGKPRLEGIFILWVVESAMSDKSFGCMISIASRLSQSGRLTSRARATRPFIRRR